MKTLNELIESGNTVLVDFYAEWCGPCKQMAPHLKEVAGKIKNKATVVKVDIDRNPNLASAFNIQGVPTLILFKDGEAKWRQSGAMTGPQMENVLNQYI
jgi:thioredoxin 1